jgi:hypothetical protein
LQFFTGLTSGHFSLVPFFPLMFLWLVLYVGHIGAHKRRASFLHAYFILNVLIICFVLASTCKATSLHNTNVRTRVPSSKRYCVASSSLCCIALRYADAAFIMFPAVLGTILCALDGGYGGGCSWGEAKAIAHLTFIGFLFAFIPCFPAV